MKYTKGTKALDTKKMILKRTNEIFEEYGPDTFTLNQLIKKIGLSKGRFYYHFKSKDELIYEVIIKGNFNIEQYYGEIKDKLTPPEALESVMRYMYGSIDNKVTAKQLVNYLSSLLKETTDEHFHEDLVLYFVYEDILKRGINEGYFRDDIPLNQLLPSMLNMTIGVLFTWGHSNNRFTLSNYIESTIKLVLHSLTK